MKDRKCEFFKEEKDQLGLNTNILGNTRALLTIKASIIQAYSNKYTSKNTSVLVLSVFRQIILTDSGQPFQSLETQLWQSESQFTTQATVN